ncbi:MAG: electron transfer flavoprotein subunit alpha/FixB family protein [Dissulfuribacterales bacterium]
MNKGVWVFAEQKGDELLEVSLELISEARKLADQLREELSTILFGNNVNGLAEILVQYGPENIFIADDVCLNRYAPDIYTSILAGLIKKYDPSVFLLGATTVGKDIAPRVAARVKTGLSTNCDKLQISEDGLLLQTRLCYLNKIHTTVVCPKSRPQMATVQPGVMKIKKVPLTGESSSPKIVRLNINDYIPHVIETVKVVGFIKANPKTIDITDAELIVAGGKGVGNEENFRLIHELADLLKASVAGSRMAVDNGCISRERQIGQSGKTVSPELMISCGISGASAHTYGMKESKNIIVINNDKAAPILKMADLGVIGDLHEIIPVLNDRLKRVLPEEKDERDADN